MTQNNTQIQALTHLLELAQNIIYSIGMDSHKQIINKYQALKKAYKVKLKAQNQQRQSIEKQFYLMYKNMVDQIIICMSAFQAEMQSKMKSTLEEQLYNFKIKFENEIDKLMKISSARRRLQIKEQISNYQHKYKEVSAKFENLSLLLEIHGKMHEIIEQAAHNEVRRQQKQGQYIRRIENYENKFANIENVDLFIDQYQVTKTSYEQFKLIQRQLKNVLNETIN